MRGIRTIKNTKPARKAVRAAATTSSNSTRKAAAKPAVERVPVVTKGEMKAQVEKLERTVATLRAKSREANRAAKASASRIADLEGQVASLEKQVAAVHEDNTARELRSVESGDIVSSTVGAVDVGSAWEAEEVDVDETAEEAEARTPRL